MQKFAHSQDDKEMSFMPTCQINVLGFSDVPLLGQDYRTRLCQMKELTKKKTSVQ